MDQAAKCEASRTTRIESLKEYLRASAQWIPQNPLYSLLLKYGEEFKVPLVAPHVIRGRRGMCFMNATHLGTVWGGYYGYAEGYFLHPVPLIPIHHAWNYDLATGEVIDSTLGHLPGATYFGIRIPDAKLKKQLKDSGYYGAFDCGAGVSDLVINWQKSSKP